MTVTVQPDLLVIDVPFHLELMRVPAGEFMMGSDPARDNFAQPDELPQQSIYLSEFYIGKYEITKAQYTVFAHANDMPLELLESAESSVGKDDYPAVRMSWHEAVAFCAWVSQMSGRQVRLPTEAEWERAARGTAGQIYPWGDKWDKTALNTNDGGVGDTAAVHAFSPAGDSPYGVADMAGNVWEWTADWYGVTTYADRVNADASLNDPIGPASGTHRVLRGGSYYFRQSGTRAAKRFKYVPASRCYDIAFRVVVTDL